MSLKLYYHLLSSFCMKVLIALYENDAPFEREVVDLGDPAQSAKFKELWPIRKFPVLRDNARDRLIPESSIIIEYLDQYFPGRVRFIPQDREIGRQVRFHDRFYDLHLHLQMQKVVGDWLRPPDKRDPLGVEQAKALIHTALGMVDSDMAAKTWCMGSDFTLGDCSAGPPLFYIDKVMPIAETYRNAYRYLERLKARPSFARALVEAEPYSSLFPVKRAAS
jgi:glutathione S-transferase